MTDKILCPWCGREMKVFCKHDFPDGFITATAICARCGARGPSEHALDSDEVKKAARAAALRRYEPPCRPLTEEEVRKHFEEKDASPVWVQYSNPIVMTSGWRGFNFIATMFPLPDEIYGKTWRCWPRKPTDDERQAAGWEDAEC